MLRTNIHSPHQYMQSKALLTPSEFRVFEEVEDVRAAMGEASKERERMEDAEKADARRGFAQDEIRVKQQFKVIDLKKNK